jgi:photosynthetic reaction center H subunit
MEFGAVTGYIDLAQLLLYAFWLFFAGLIYYLVREGHREGYPMETDGLARTANGFPVPSQPKVFKTVHGDVLVPDPNKGEPAYRAAGTYASPGSPIEPVGDPLTAGVGAGAWANRADTPDLMNDGSVKIVPLRAASAWGVSGNDADPRGLPVIGGDFKTGGTVVDIWVDQSEFMFRYLEVETPLASGGTRRVLLPIPFARIGRKQVDVKSIYGHQFAGVPGLRTPDQVTFLEEEKICAYYGAGTLYADPQRAEPIL